jgi:sporulation integral membrane protein YlbJ
MDIKFFGVGALQCKYRYILAVSAASFACLFMVFFPSVSLLSAQKGIALWANNILPAMLPFFICANFMNYIGITKYLKPSFFAFAMSALSGYPMGAKVIADMGRCGYISKRECLRLISFCSTSGPAFIVGSVGAAMIGNNIAGGIIAVSHFAGALLNGVLFTCLLNLHACKSNNSSMSYNAKGFKENQTKLQKFNNHETENNYLDIFTEAIISSFKSLGIILAYIVMFMMLTDIIEYLGLLDGINSLYLKGVAKGFLEMTLGCASISSSMLIPLSYKIVGCSMLISFGGLSIIGQSMSMLSGTQISIWYLLLVKICHGAIAGGLSILLVNMFF